MAADMIKETTTRPRRERLHGCYKAMIVTTFVVVMCAAGAAILAVTNVVQIPGLSPTPSTPGPSPAPSGLRGGAAGGNTPAPAPAAGSAGGGQQLPVEKQTLGRSGVVKPDAKLDAAMGVRARGPMKAWSVLRPLAAKNACVDLREFPAEQHARLAAAVRAANKAGDTSVAFADAAACAGALVARRPTDDKAAGKSFGVPAGGASKRTFGVPDAVNDRKLLSLVELDRSKLISASAPAAAAAAAAPNVVALQPNVVRYVWAKNLAALSAFFENFDWTAYYGDQCRHKYRDSNMNRDVEFDFRPNGGRCKVSGGASAASYYKPCLYHPMVSPAALGACVGPDCGSTMQAKSDAMYRGSVSVVRFDQPAGTTEAVVRTNVGLGAAAADKRKVQVAGALFSTNPAASHCPAAPWTHRALLGGASLSDAADFDDHWRVYALDPAAGFRGREYVELYPHSFVMDTEVNLKASLEAEIKAAVKAEQPEADAIGVEVTILDARSFSVYTTLVLDRDSWFSATKYIQTRTQYQIVHHAHTIQVGVFHRSWAWQTSSSVLWFVADALDDGASGMARQVSAQVSATLAAQFADSLPAGPDGGVVAASATTLTLGNDGKVFALVAL